MVHIKKIETINKVKNFQELKEEIDKEIQEIENEKIIKIKKTNDEYYIETVKY